MLPRHAAIELATLASQLDTTGVMIAQALAEAAGEGQAQHAEEVSALADEADMPLEQLLAQYGYVIGEDGRKRPADDTQAACGDDSSAEGGLFPCISSCVGM